MSKKGSGKKKTKAQQVLARLAGRYYDNRCYICHKNIGKGFSLHHIYYLKTGEIKYTDYKSRDQYYTALGPVVAADPDRFALLCIKHHYMVEATARLLPAEMEPPQKDGKHDA